MENKGWHSSSKQIFFSKSLLHLSKIEFIELKLNLFSYLFIATRASVPNEAQATNMTMKP